MNEREKQQLVDDYLRRLSKGLEGVPASARRDLVEDVRGHIEEAWAASPEQSRSVLLNILERLGEPEHLAKEERERLGLDQYSQPSGPVLLEVVAIVLTVFVWPVGILLAWLSPRWYTRDKAIAIAIPLIGLVLLWTAVVPIQVSTSAHPITAQSQVVAVGQQQEQSSTTPDSQIRQQTDNRPWAALISRLMALYGVLGAPLTAAAFLALRMRPHPRTVAMLAPALAAILLVCFLLSAWFAPVATGGGPAMQQTEPIGALHSIEPVNVR